MTYVIVLYSNQSSALLKISGEVKKKNKKEVQGQETSKDSCSLSEWMGVLKHTAEQHSYTWLCNHNHT